MNELKVFENTEFGEIRTINENGKVLFCGSDVAKALGYAVPKDAITAHCKGAVKRRLLTNGGEQDVKFISEGDVYRLITHSKLPTAEKFEKWVFDDVLPTIRTTGGYVSNDDLFIQTYFPFADDTTKAMFRQTLETVRTQNEIIKRQQQEIEHKEDVIGGLVDEIDLAEKRQILNRVVRHNNANYADRWRILYREFECKYHIDLSRRVASYNAAHKPKCKNKLEYIDRVMNKIPELYELAAKLFENDIKELISEMYAANS